ncbi:type II toxin-antitoxin system death-on-curing family toxin [Mycoplasma zalophi]|uniref:Type II toxin-antitoxin system death-on-curing family toxin n=1 Tax=Mycoplasma zalophi TaxID=191287 RepID=A0ABS6DQQ7_9MOLU|nr:type II toxin-antitoxin system death-on-curing family toxin [Mycoplasma zalophi]MBU4692185.1 type II toxin-antitoxin system death-on-curing family toxin [Mycoplasma zalophi]
MRIKKLIVSSIEVKNSSNFIKQHKNSLIKIQKDKYIFESHFNKPTEIIFELIDLSKKDSDFWVGFGEIICKKTFKIALEYAKKIKTENKDTNDFCLREDFNIDNFFLIQLNKFSYLEEDWSIFDLISALFISLLNSHLFLNGNKRFAFTFLQVLTKQLGYYFKWSSFLYDRGEVYDKNIEKELERFVILLSNETTKNILNKTNTKEYKKCVEIIKNVKSDVNERKENVKEYIKKWIKQNIYINY